MDKFPLLVICLIFLFLIPVSPALYAQSIGMGTNSPNASSALDITGTTRGLLIPRLTSSAISLIPNPAKGLMVLDTSQNQLLVNMGTPGAPHWQNVLANIGWRLTGNTGTDTAYNFIGTKDTVPLIFKVNNKIAGYIAYKYLNTAFGVRTMNESLTAGEVNTAIGIYALQNNSAGEYSLANGAGSLGTNTDGTLNTAVGADALPGNTSGYSNIALGHYASRFLRIGYNNMAIGHKSLYSNQQGSRNIAIGDSTMTYNVASDLNISVGYNAGNGGDMGTANSILGANSSIPASENNDVAIGQQVTCTGSNQIRIGNSATYSIGGFADWTNISDGRYKMNIREDVQGLEFIMKLRPVTYHLDVTGLSRKLNEYSGKEPMPLMKTAMARKEAVVETGFIAQEVEQAAITTGYAFSGVDKPGNSDGLYGLRYAVFVVPLIKALHQQQEIIARLKQRMDSLENQIVFLQANREKTNH